MRSVTGMLHCPTSSKARLPISVAYEHMCCSWVQWALQQPLVLGAKSTFGDPCVSSAQTTRGKPLRPPAAPHPRPHPLCKALTRCTTSPQPHQHHMHSGQNPRCQPTCPSARPVAAYARPCAFSVPTRADNPPHTPACVPTPSPPALTPAAPPSPPPASPARRPPPPPAG